jgi:hypothetical protein
MLQFKYREDRFVTPRAASMAIAAYPLFLRVRVEVQDRISICRSSFAVMGDRRAAKAKRASGAVKTNVEFV